MDDKKEDKDMLKEQVRVDKKILLQRAIKNGMKKTARLFSFSKIELFLVFVR